MILIINLSTKFSTPHLLPEHIPNSGRTAENFRCCFLKFMLTFLKNIGMNQGKQ